MRCTPRRSRLPILAVFALPISACNGNGAPNDSPPFVPAVRQLPAWHAQIRRVHRHSGASGKIQHVVIIVQENRSFNNLFYGFKGAKTAKYGYDTTGDKIALESVGVETTWAGTMASLRLSSTTTA